MMHAKSMVVDGLWSSVGSMNFDNRSLSFNDESVLVSLDGGIGAQMDSIFMDDLKWSKEMKLDEFRKRSVWSKILEWGAQKLRRLL
jgi:cardiolipin synthase